jgi:hypothetical protein
MYGPKALLKKFKIFDVLISKIIFKKLKNIILMYFRIKNTLKNNRNHTPNRHIRTEKYLSY